MRMVLSNRFKTIDFPFIGTCLFKSSNLYKNKPERVFGLQVR